MGNTEPAEAFMTLCQPETFMEESHRTRNHAVMTLVKKVINRIKQAPNKGCSSLELWHDACDEQIFKLLAAPIRKPSDKGSPNNLMSYFRTAIFNLYQGICAKLARETSLDDADHITHTLAALIEGPNQEREDTKKDLEHFKTVIVPKCLAKLRSDAREKSAMLFEIEWNKALGQPFTAPESWTQPGQAA